MKRRSKVITTALYISSALCFLIGVLLIVLLRLLQIDEVALWYSKYTDILLRFEKTIENLPNPWLTALFIESNFMIKAFVPWFPISIICFASGVMFKWYIAIPLNIIGLAMLMTVNFFVGRWKGGGNAERVLTKLNIPYKTVIEEQKVGSMVLLFFLRFIPAFPINMVSRFYGAHNITYKRYILISFLGFTYKLISYTLVGRNIYDPLSSSFILPLIPLFFLSAVAFLILNGAIRVTLTARNRIIISRSKKQINVNKGELNEAQ